MLMLNNSTKMAFVVKPTLYSLSGKGAQIDPVPLAAHETKEIDLSQWVAGLGPEYLTGSIRLESIS